MSIVLMSGLMCTWYLPFLRASQDSLPPWMMTVYSRTSPPASIGSRRTVPIVGAVGTAAATLGGCAASASTEVSTISSEPSPISDFSGLEARSFFRMRISSLRAALASSRALSSV